MTHGRVRRGILPALAQWMAAVAAISTALLAPATAVHASTFASQSTKMSISGNSTAFTIVQTIKSSFDQIGPLQCETVCAVKGEEMDRCINRFVRRRALRLPRPLSTATPVLLFPMTRLPVSSSLRESTPLL